MHRNTQHRRIAMNNSPLPESDTKSVTSKRFTELYENSFTLPSLVAINLECFFTRKWDHEYVTLRCKDGTLVHNEIKYHVVDKTSPLTPKKDSVFLSFRKARNTRGVVIIRNFKETK